MTNDSMNSGEDNALPGPKKSKFDLEERTACFGEAEARVLWQEAKELHLIFAAIIRKG